MSCTCRSVCPPAERDGRQSRTLHAVMRPQAAGKEAIAIAHVNLVPAPGTRRPDRARHQPGPRIDVRQRVADHRGFAGRARRRVDARDPVLRHREHAERIVIAQIGLGRERKPRQIGKRSQVRRMHARRVELGPVGGHVLVRVRQAVFQAFKLQRLDGVAAGGLDRIERQVGRAGAHAVSSGRRRTNLLTVLLHVPRLALRCSPYLCTVALLGQPRAARYGS